MILNTGMRTDIPAFFSDWFFKRIKEVFGNQRFPLHFRRKCKENKRFVINLSTR